MSYILEALKKAQAERQLGSAPTIHAIPIHTPTTEPASAKRGPLLVLAGGAVVIAAVLAWYLKAPAAQAPVVLTAAPAVIPVQVPVQVPAPAPAPAAIRPPPLIAPPPVAMPAPVVAAAPKPLAAKAEPTPVVAPAPAPEEHLQTLRELPEAIQREVPNVAIGGYIYSKNPADRLLLIDKILRKEGEEVAPGLVLEKLMPKAAVMNYRGTRYRVQY